MACSATSGQVEDLSGLASNWWTATITGVFPKVIRALTDRPEYKPTTDLRTLLHVFTTRLMAEL